MLATRSLAVVDWLAWQAEPGTPLGLAFTRKYLKSDHKLASDLRDWLYRLFLVPEAPDAAR
ncbi:MAG: hypothetical protein Tsb0020_52360 [Haliangiales bacterium]